MSWWDPPPDRINLSIKIYSYLGQHLHWSCTRFELISFDICFDFHQHLGWSLMTAVFIMSTAVLQGCWPHQYLSRLSIFKCCLDLKRYRLDLILTYQETGSLTRGLDEGLHLSDEGLHLSDEGLHLSDEGLHLSRSPNKFSRSPNKFSSGFKFVDGMFMARGLQHTVKPLI